MGEAQRSTELSPAKHRQILVGARHVFIELGFERASVGQIAERAGVSKATLYNHFADKAALFMACIDEMASELRAELQGIMNARSADVGRDLYAIGEKLMTFMLSPNVVALHRVIMAEVPRFPEVGRGIYELVRRYMRELLAAHLKEWSDRGELCVEDPMLAAMQFFDLCRGDPEMRVELGVASEISEDEVRATVAAALWTFLRAYRA